MKKNTLTVDPIMLQDELLIRREKLSPNRRSRFLKTEWRKQSFWFLNFEISSASRKPISEIFIGFRAPLFISSYAKFVSWQATFVFVDDKTAQAKLQYAHHHKKLV